MTDKELVCTSCRTKITNIKGTTMFMCPKCEKMEIIRCFNCRERGTRYICGGCNFSGPN